MADDQEAQPFAIRPTSSGNPGIEAHQPAQSILRTAPEKLAIGFKLFAPPPAVVAQKPDNTDNLDQPSAPLPAMAKRSREPRRESSEQTSISPMFGNDDDMDIEVNLVGDLDSALAEVLPSSLLLTSKAIEDVESTSASHSSRRGSMSGTTLLRESHIDHDKAAPAQTAEDEHPPRVDPMQLYTPSSLSPIPASSNDQTLSSSLVDIPCTDNSNKAASDNRRVLPPFGLTSPPPSRTSSSPQSSLTSLSPTSSHGALDETFTQTTDNTDNDIPSQSSPAQICTPDPSPSASGFQSPTGHASLDESNTQITDDTLPSTSSPVQPIQPESDGDAASEGPSPCKLRPRSTPNQLESDGNAASEDEGSAEKGGSEASSSKLRSKKKRSENGPSGTSASKRSPCKKGTDSKSEPSVSRPLEQVNSYHAAPLQIAEADMPLQLRTLRAKQYGALLRDGDDGYEAYNKVS